MNEIASKSFPEHYPADVLAVLDAMSLTGLKGFQLMGSMSIRSQLYAGDYDGFEVVPVRSVTAAARALGDSMKRLRSMPNVRIGDIKCGEVSEWRILPESAAVVDGRIQGFDAQQSAKVVDAIPSSVLNKNEKSKIIKRLQGVKAPIDLVRLKKDLKTHVVRWTPAEVIAGEKVLADGRTYTLEDGLQTPALTKVDVIALVQGRLTEFSMIYEFHQGKKVLNPVRIDPVGSLREDILYYMEEGKSFKALKRRFALAKIEKDLPTIKILTPILNSDLGRLYTIIGDIDTMLQLFETKTPPVKEIRREIDAFRSRLGNMYQLEEYLKQDKDVLGEIETLGKLPASKVKTGLERVKQRLQGILQQGAESVSDAN